MVLPVFVSVVFFIALLIGYPWHILSAGSVLYLLSLPMGWKSYRDHERAAAAQANVATEAAAPANPPADFSDCGLRRRPGQPAGPPELSGPPVHRNICRNICPERSPIGFMPNLGYRRIAAS